MSTSAIEGKDSMDESNRTATLNAIRLLALAITWTQLSAPGICQEPRKPSWMPFPMGRAAERAIPKTTPATKPDEKIIASPIPAQDPNRPDPWLLWADPLAPNTQQPGDCFFRRTMDLPEIERCFVDVESDARTEVYFNGQRVRPAKPTDGKPPEGKQRIDLQAAVKPGQNVLAIGVQSSGKSAPGVRVEFYFKPKQGNWRLVVSDGEWGARATGARATGARAT